MGRSHWFPAPPESTPEARIAVEVVQKALEDAARFHGVLKPITCCCAEPRMKEVLPSGKSITRRDWCSLSGGIGEEARARRCCCPWMSPYESAALLLLSESPCWRSSRWAWFHLAGIQEPTWGEMSLAIEGERLRQARIAARPPRRQGPRPAEPAAKRPRGRPKKVMLPEAYGD